MKTYTILAVAMIFSAMITAQNLNNEIVSEGETPFLLGLVNKEGFTKATYNEWFSKNYEDYELDLNTIELLKSKLKDYQITMFMGTWCGDSRKEVPRFYKILEACNFPEDQLTVIALSRMSYMYKQSPNHYEAGLNIHRVPTFIFYKNKTEINRIVEHPVETLEKDILNIVTTNDYKSNYQIVASVDAILREEGINGLKKRRKKLMRTFKESVSSMSELNTYARTLYSTNRLNEAIEVCKINLKMFPNNPRSYESLSIVLDANGKSNEAKKVIETAIEKFPENQDLIEQLNALNNHE